MIFEYMQDGTLNFLEAFAARTGSEITHNQIAISGSPGKGTIIMADMEAGLKMAIFHLTLQEDLVFRGNVSQSRPDVLSIRLQVSTAASHHIPFKLQLNEYAQPDTLIQLASNDIASDIRFAAGSTIFATLILVQRDLLKSLLGTNDHALVKHIICNKGPHFYNEAMTQEIQCVLALIFKTNDNELFGNLYYRIKATELIYQLFYNLAKRMDTPCISIRKDDLSKVHEVKDHILSDLSIVPELHALATMTGMSESKLKRIFKQVFGNSIYNYYQTARMNEAAYLIRKNNLSISEVGYRLGFSNLSHFSRLFDKHIGIKPKKYSLLKGEKV
ncbi:helix-turn-helix transcriptional regulator [Pseudoflavitalea sp. G-6-1-2]|uniref:AraC family transcriptional regulator n=1 Tax=Pseudoflavitalea sp. G-6-1-2 TaxID=2728841 RepID=UPI00146A3C95|nr:helix-turn-helix domain-containing protein [Pseudoflavitalea sp. G-6-1-2]NML21801.1 helix-turn-helix transcriptional regulator [Pseudoflavitalea sp. G-6-1-2]